MTEFRNHDRPDWCPHADCQFVLHTQAMACVGHLPEPADHGPHSKVNDGRFCMLDADNGEVVDWQVNKGDLLGLKRLFGALYPPITSPDP